MAQVTCKYFTYAKVSGGGAGSAVTYTGGTMLNDYLAKVDINEARGDVKEYADGKLIDSEQIPTEATMALELVNNNASIMEDVLGLTTVSSDLMLTANDPPMVGAGCVIQDRYKGSSTFRAYWFFKTQFTSGGISASTRRESTTFEHETITGRAMAVQLAADGADTFYACRSGMTEQAAIAWLKGKAGIS